MKANPKFMNIIINHRECEPLKRATVIITYESGRTRTFRSDAENYLEAFFELPTIFRKIGWREERKIKTMFSTYYYYEKV